jgi:hypothetical protein
VTIALLREPLLDALRAERVLELPKFVRSRTYWHVPRSAAMRDGRLGVSCWCGVSFHGRKQTLELRDDEPDENVCGTCIGRWEGAQAGGALIFRPRDEFGMPTWCPSTESDDLNHCIACGRRVYYSWQRGAVTRHRPDPGLLDRCRPCPDHGWSRAGTRGDRIVCWAHVGHEFGYCDFDCGPTA